ncbi:MAG: SRPBCC family protein [Methylomonas sp.]|jgi:ligand-binding SRPBCC domain-containing protein|uniref:SRPBCC family protein n=1 Tax=Methylomonas sp. TaxID=418 RepID=UPI0025DA74C4|nr:SRPBCC family protein [Methylomonas sp.]MCK9605131.1 SRPBCC family protein [Methylomonas sp.]
MNLYQLYRRQALNLTRQEAWDFFSSPHYLNHITPAFFNVEITSRVPAKIYTGLMIGYRMKAVFGWPMPWLSEISHCNEPHRFVYQQAVGPFKFWSHEVCLTEEQGHVVMEDLVFYAMPWGWLGQVMHRLLIGGKLQRIFDTRQNYLQAKWGVDV